MARGGYQERMKEDGRKQAIYINHLERQLNDALNELGYIAAGIVVHDQPDDWSVQTRLQDRAARFLKKLALTGKPSKPMTAYW